MIVLSIMIEILMLGFALFVYFKKTSAIREYAIAFILYELIKYSLLLLPTVQLVLPVPPYFIFIWIGIPMICSLIHSYITKSMVGRYLFVLLVLFLILGASQIWKWLPFVYLIYLNFNNKQTNK